MVKDKNKMCEHYNKTARGLIHPQCNQWTPATVTKTPVASLTTNGAQLVRNRRFVRPGQETAPIPAESMKRDDSSGSERPRRVITRPKRLIVSVFQLRPKLSSIRGEMLHNQLM